MTLSFVSGIDVGSVSAKAVIMDEDSRVVSYSILPTGAGSKRAAEAVMREALTKASLQPQDISFIVATGYGRLMVPSADIEITEITCHARGAYWLFPEVRTVIDIGGQDSKVISLDDRGLVRAFTMNDKCAAGTGRFLEVMANALEVGLEEMGGLSLKSCHDLRVSSMCTVFAESEVVSLIAAGHDQADILAAIHHAIARRILGMVGLQGLKEKVVMSGGVAKNLGVARALEKELETNLLIPTEPQIVGALGAAIMALERAGVFSKEV